MLKRGLSALVGIGIFLALCFGGLLPFAIGATVIAALATYEWVTAYQRADKMEAKAGDRPRMPRWLNVINTVVAWASVLLPVYALFQCRFSAAYGFKPIHNEIIVLLFAPAIVGAFLTMRAARTGKALGGLRSVYGIIAFFYIDLLMSSLVYLRGLNYGPKLVHTTQYYLPFQRIQVPPFGQAERGAWLMLLVAVCVWMTDTGAYLVGRKWGRHKLAPALSPNKTVEGSLGGLTLAVVTGVCFGVWIHLPWQHGLAVGLIAGVMGQMGDLFESALKREIGIKDFGGIMPGHGGALDRFDSLLFVTPLAFCYLHFVAGL